MTAVLILLAAIVGVGAVLYILHPKGSKTVEPRQSCCGQHAVCERDSLLAAVSDKIEYFDDEELDIYAGRDAASYSDDEAEQFRDIVLTMDSAEVPAWCRSLTLRNIELPAQVREEVLMIVAERRAADADI